MLDGASEAHGVATRAAGAPIVQRETRAAPVQLEANTAVVRVEIVAFVAHGEEYAAEKVEGCNGEVRDVSRTGKFCGVSSCFGLKLLELGRRFTRE